MNATKTWYKGQEEDLDDDRICRHMTKGKLVKQLARHLFVSLSVRSAQILRFVNS